MTIAVHFLPEIEVILLGHLLSVPFHQFLSLLGGFGIRIILFQGRNWTAVILKLGAVEEMWKISFGDIFYPENRRQRCQRSGDITVRVYQSDVEKQRRRRDLLAFHQWILGSTLSHDIGGKIILVE